MAIMDDFISRFTCFDPLEVHGLWNNIDPGYKCYYNFEYDGDISCKTEIILNLCAHLFVVYSLRGTSAPKIIDNKSVGPITESYNNSNLDERASFFKASKYGQMFLQMTASGASGAFFI